MGRTVITNIQVLRFFAAVCILVTHSADLLIAQNSIIFDFPWQGGVDLFFAISGFIMTWLTRDRFGERGVPARFLLRRAIRIVPPYWFFTTMMIGAILLAQSHVRWTRLGPAEVIASYAFVPWPRASDGNLNPILSQGWTLNYEAFFYAAFAIALCFRNGLRWLVAAFILLAVAHYAVPDRLFVLKFYSNPMILEFVAGIAIALLYIRGVRISRRGALALGGLAALTFLAMAIAPPLEDDRFLKLGLPASFLFASFALLPEPPRQGVVRRFLVLGGDASYTLYLSHAFTANFVALLALHYWPGNPWWTLALAVAAAVAVAIALYRFLERPVTDALSRFAKLGRPTGLQRVAP